MTGKTQGMSAKARGARLFRENRVFILFMLLMFCFRSAIADWSHVPSGSMLPTIVEGDRIFVDKVAYDIRIPFTHISFASTGEPARGDIVIFDSKVAGKRLVKRLIGLPDDVLKMHNNVLFVNGKGLSHDRPESTSVKKSYVPDGYREHEERLASESHSVRIYDQGSALSSFAAVRVPEGHYFMLGDNRDNSADSRVIGFVPRAEIVGKTEHVVMSLNYNNYYLPRPDRFLQKL